MDLFSRLFRSRIPVIIATELQDKYRAKSGHLLLL